MKTASIRATGKDNTSLAVEVRSSIVATLLMPSSAQTLRKYTMPRHRICCKPKSDSSLWFRPMLLHVTQHCVMHDCSDMNKLA